MKLKKPKFWDDKKPCFLSYFFLPLTLPIIVNNFFLKRKIKQSNQKIKKICVGNIYVGGTAKTPLTVKIYKILKDLKYNTATIKKYYKNQIDEQKILNSNTRLYCEKNRNLALSQAIKDSVHVVIFDDGLQDRSISYDLSFVCFNNIKWVGNGFLIPAGPLREKIESISRYDAIFLNGNERDNSDIKSVICKYNKEIPVFESTYKASNDHYQYTENDINNITLHAKRLNAKILTTEKDYTKINYNKKYDIKCLKIELTIKDEQKLINFLKLYI